jgi:hypothetical protein
MSLLLMLQHFLLLQMLLLPLQPISSRFLLLLVSWQHR